jgi:DNA-binding NarL/FixJ family response regulator
MLSTPQEEVDVLRSYQLHANAYIAKRATFDSFTEAIKQVADLFLSLAKLPG